MASHIQMDFPTITVSELYNIHQQQLHKNESNSDNTEMLVEIIGGIDSILADYLCSENNNLLLDDLQMQKIHSVITSKSTNNRIKQVSDISESDNQIQQRKYTYYFRKTNTFMHSIFGLQTATKIFNIITNKILIILYCLSAIVITATSFTLQYSFIYIVVKGIIFYVFCVYEIF